MTRYRITDEAGTSGQVVVDADHVTEALRPWYPEAPEEVYEQIQALEDALANGAYTEADQYLAVRVEEVD
jgi:hypothetical protein